MGVGDMGVEVCDVCDVPFLVVGVSCGVVPCGFAGESVEKVVEENRPFREIGEGIDHSVRSIHKIRLSTFQVDEAEYFLIVIRSFQRF